MDKKKLLGVAGSVALFIGVFLPVISVPIIGDINMFLNGEGDGVYLLIMAGVSLIMALLGKFKWLWFTGLGSLSLILYGLYSCRLMISEMKDKLNLELADNPFRGLADMAMQSIQLQWGWAVLISGTLMLIIAAAMKGRVSNAMINDRNSQPEKDQCLND